VGRAGRSATSRPPHAGLQSRSGRAVRNHALADRGIGNIKIEKSHRADGAIPSRRHGASARLWRTGAELSPWSLAPPRAGPSAPAARAARTRVLLARGVRVVRTVRGPRGYDRLAQALSPAARLHIRPIRRPAGYWCRRSWGPVGMIGLQASGVAVAGTWTAIEVPNAWGAPRPSACACVAEATRALASPRLVTGSSVAS
jgi:hypothetical protein